MGLVIGQDDTELGAGGVGHVVVVDAGCRAQDLGDRLEQASSGFDPRGGEPVVNFRFNSAGARKFGAATVENVELYDELPVVDRKRILGSSIDACEGSRNSSAPYVSLMF